MDKDAKSFYVNTDDEISVSSYNAIAKDENDVVYAVIKDYMVKTLVIYEKDGNTDPVTPPRAMILRSRTSISTLPIPPSSSMLNPARPPR